MSASRPRRLWWRLTNTVLRCPHFGQWTGLKQPPSRSKATRTSVVSASDIFLKIGDINKMEPNILAGVKYFRFMVDQFYKDEPMDPLNKGLMTLASYNAGPGRIRQLRRETEKRGLNPNIWFGNVERVVSERVGRETVTYVSNIYKYYVAYNLVMAQRQARAQAKESVKKSQ